MFLKPKGSLYIIEFRIRYYFSLHFSINLNYIFKAQCIEHFLINCRRIHIFQGIVVVAFYLILWVNKTPVDSLFININLK